LGEKVAEGTAERGVHGLLLHSSYYVYVHPYAHVHTIIKNFQVVRLLTEPRIFEAALELTMVVSAFAHPD
jgi:hypothetical protein